MRPGAFAGMSDIYLRVVGRTDVGNVRSNNEDSFVVADLSGNALIGAEGASGRFEVGDRGVLLAVSDGMGGLRPAKSRARSSSKRSRARSPSRTPARRRAARRGGAERTSPCSERRAARHPHGRDADGRLCPRPRRVDRRGRRLARVPHSVRGDHPAHQGPEPGAAPRRRRRCRRGRSGALSIPGVILQAMGHQPNVCVALGRLELRARDCLLLCSDGLTAHVGDEDMRTILLASPDLRTRATASSISRRSAAASTTSPSSSAASAGRFRPRASRATTSRRPSRSSSRSDEFATELPPSGGRSRYFRSSSRSSVVLPVGAGAPTGFAPAERRGAAVDARGDGAGAGDARSTRGVLPAFALGGGAAAAVSTRSPCCRAGTTMAPGVDGATTGSGLDVGSTSTRLAAETTGPGDAEGAGSAAPWGHFAAMSRHPATARPPSALPWRSSSCFACFPRRSPGASCHEATVSA